MHRLVQKFAQHRARSNVPSCATCRCMGLAAPEAKLWRTPRDRSARQPGFKASTDLDPWLTLLADLKKDHQISPWWSKSSHEMKHIAVPALVRR